MRIRATAAGLRMERGERDPDKIVPEPPSLGNTGEPSGQFGLDTPGAAQQPLYLPLVQG